MAKSILMKEVKTNNGVKTVEEMHPRTTSDEVSFSSYVSNASLPELVRNTKTLTSLLNGLGSLAFLSSVASSDKASKDSAGNVITGTYLKGVTLDSGTNTLKGTLGNGQQIDMVPDITTKSYTDNLFSTTVKSSGDQSVKGIKTFTDGIKVGNLSITEQTVGYDQVITFGTN